MISELCKEINNWDFVKGAKKYFGKFRIENGELLGFEEKLQQGQYFRIAGSVFNDGVYTYPASSLKDEIFDGAVWAMAIPEEVIALADEIDAWIAKYGGVDSANMSPYNSESFGGYSYSKSGGGAATGGAGAGGTWQTAFAQRLNRWRKI